LRALFELTYMDETVLQQNQKQDSTPAQGSPGAKREPRRGGRLILFLFVGLACLAALAVYGVMTRSAATEKLEQQANQTASEQTVTVVKPERLAASVSVELPGQTQAYVQAPVFAQTSGYLKQWYFDIGAHVKAGDVLAELDTPQVDQQLNQAKATVKEAQAALDLSRVTYQRDQDLLQRRVIAQQDFDTAASDLGVKQATLNADEAAVLSLQALEDFKIVKVPFDGLVTARNTDIGALVNSGSGNPLFTVAQVKPLRVYINVPEGMAQDVAVGANAELRFNEFPGREFSGKVVRTAGAIDPNSRTLLTEVDVPNESGELFPGAYTQVRLVTGAKNRSVLVPANTLLFRAEGAAVGVVDQNNVVELKKIKIGRDLGNQLEVTQGVGPDDRIIVNPSDSLAAGQKVKVRPTQEEKKQASATPAAKNS
jgi:RND family efflux transporter MFP subunit